MNKSPKFENIPAEVNSALQDAITIGIRFKSEARNMSSTVATASADAVTQLTAMLYTHWYCQTTLPKRVGSFFNDQNYIEILRAAHAGSYRWEDGWKAEKVSSMARVIALKGNEHRILTTLDYVCPDRPGLFPIPGNRLQVVARRDSVEVAPGFWSTWTRGWQDTNKPSVRLYWNISSEGAPVLVRCITQNIGDETSYCLKVPVNPLIYDRADAAVLYFPSEQFSELSPAVRRIHKAVLQFLNPEVPKLSKKLATGLGLAEDPLESADSFGLSRCHLIAEGIFEATQARTKNNHDMLKRVYHRFFAAGISLQKPYLNPSSRQDYEY